MVCATKAAAMICSENRGRSKSGNAFFRRMAFAERSLKRKPRARPCCFIEAAMFVDFDRVNTAARKSGCGTLSQDLSRPQLHARLLSDEHQRKLVEMGVREESEGNPNSESN
jgi:hypothetical protein